MKKIGIISDTHGKLSNQVFEIFANVDQIWHAGDVGAAHLIDELKIIAPVQCVCGNVDGYPLCTIFPEQKIIRIDNFRFLLTHRFFDQSMRIFPSVKKFLTDDFDAIIYGHTHIADLRNGTNDILFFNPGSATMSRSGKPPSVGLLTISDDEKLHFELHFLSN